MSGISNISAKSKVYVDTNIWIYYFKGEGEFYTPAAKVINSLFQKKCPLVISNIFFTEYLARYSKADAEFLYKDLQDSLFSRPNVLPRFISNEIAVRAAVLRAEYGIKTPDALHLATAIENGCKAFITHDQKLKKVKGIAVVTI